MSDDSCASRFAAIATVIFLVVLAASWLITSVQSVINQATIFLQNTWNELNQIFQQVINFFKNLFSGLEIPENIPPNNTKTPTLIANVTFTPAANGGDLTIGDRAIVMNTKGDRLNCRENHEKNSAVIIKLAEGTEVTIIDGPFSQDGFVWWQVEPPSKEPCWVAGNWLYPLSSLIPQTPTFQPPPIPIPGATPIPTPTPFLEPIPFPTPTSLPLATRTPDLPPYAKPPITVKRIEAAKVFEGYGISLGCQNLKGNPLGYYKKITYYSGWWYIDANGVAYYGWFNDFEKGAVIGPLDIDWQQTFPVCDVP